MKILLDECLPLDFRHCLPGHEVHTAQWVGLKGKKNGELLAAAEVAGYHVLLTVDQGLPQQQPIAGRNLAVVLIRSRSNQMEDLSPLAAAILKTLEFIQRGQTVAVPFSS